MSGINDYEYPKRFLAESRRLRILGEVMVGGSADGLYVRVIRHPREEQANHENAFKEN